MSRSRQEFTDPQRAEIYVRDRATCCFSGANLWLLDSPLRPGYQLDWVDHVKPRARGGKATLGNGVCASHTFNAKKRHNSADTGYLFENGLPTCLYFAIFGRTPADLESRLDRLSRLTTADWYLNRAIGLVLIGFDYRCEKEQYGQRPVRNDRYWFKAAYRRLSIYQAQGEGPSVEDRRIVEHPSATAEAWLSLRSCEDQRRFKSVIESLFPQYRANYRAWAGYFYDCDTDAERALALGKAERASDLTDDVLQCLRGDFGLRQQTREGELRMHVCSRTGRGDALEPGGALGFPGIDEAANNTHPFHQITSISVAGMPAITIKNLPDDLYVRLKANSQAHHRSINGELIATLERALTVQPADPERQLAEIRALRTRLALPTLDPDEIRGAIASSRL